MALQVGVDVGQMRDYTAIVVTESRKAAVPGLSQPVVDERIDTGWGIIVRSGASLPPPDSWTTFYSGRLLQRLPLGTSYPAVAARIAQVIATLNRRYPDQTPRLTVDATGVGRPIMDMVSSHLEQANVTLVAMTFATGDAYRPLLHQRTVWQEMRLGKGYLVSRLQALLQTRRLELADSETTRTLTRELLDYNMRIGQDGHNEMGAMRVGSHDDIVTALALAVLEEEGGEDDPDIRLLEDHKGGRRRWQET